MISIIIGIFGNSKHSIINTSKVIDFYSQYSYVDIVLVDLLPEGSNSRFKNLPSCVQLKELYATKKHEDLFQKEALWNYAIQFTKYDNLLFLDGDVICEDAMWLPDIYEKLQEDDYILQPFTFANDTSNDETCNKQSFLSYILSSTHSIYNKTPGYAIAMRKSTIQRFGGFNNWAFTGSADMLFFQEHAYHIPVFPDGLKNDWISDIKNITHPHDKYDFLPNTIIHLHHGPLTTRNYGVRDLLVELTCEISNKKIPNLLEKDENGLLMWKNVENLTKEFMHRMYEQEFMDFNNSIEHINNLKNLMMESNKKYADQKIHHSPKTYHIFMEEDRVVKFNGWGKGTIAVENGKTVIKLKPTESCNLAIMTGWLSLKLKDTTGYISFDYKSYDDTTLSVSLIDANNKKSNVDKHFYQPNGQWANIKIPFRTFDNKDFDWNKTRLLSIDNQSATSFFTNIKIVVE